MITLTHPEQNILGPYSLTGGTFHDIRYEKPDWVLRTEAWVDLVAPDPQYTGILITRTSTGETLRPIYIPMKIILHEVEALRFLWSASLPVEVPVDVVDPQIQAELVQLENFFDRIGIPCEKATRVQLADQVEQTLTYDQFIAEVATAQGVVEGHNCEGLAGMFHLSFRHPHDLQLLVKYGQATVMVGQDTLHA